jgi:hypothetical protein
MVTDRLRALARDTRLQVGVALFVVLTFLYSVVIAGQILLWIWLMGYLVGLAGFLFALYLLVRFVLAVERLADAADRIADGAHASGTETHGTTDELADSVDPGSERSVDDGTDAGTPVDDGTDAGTPVDDGSGSDDRS